MAITLTDSNPDNLVTSSTGSVTDVSNSYLLSAWFKGTKADNLPFSKAVWNSGGFSFALNNSIPITFLFHFSPSQRAYGGPADYSSWINVVFARYSGNMYQYVNGDLVTPNQSWAMDSYDISPVTCPIQIGGVGYFSWSPFAGSIFDARIYKAPSFISEHATIAKIIYEERGGDNITDGLVWRSCLMDGGDGSNVSTAIDASINGLTLAPNSGTPKWSAEAFRGF